MTLNEREVWQVLREIASGTRGIRRIGAQSWNELYCGLLSVDADGWVITFYNACDGRAFVYEVLQGSQADPVELLSAEEHSRLEGRLSSL